MRNVCFKLSKVLRMESQAQSPHSQLSFLPGPLLKKAVSDSNAPAQEKALDALIAFQTAADADANK